MSTIKSSAENLTLNADGANNDVIIQSNGSTLVTVDGSATNVGIGTTTPAQKLSLNTGYVQVGNGIGGAGGVKYPYSSANADCRNYRTRSDMVEYGDWGLEQSTTQSGETYSNKLRVSQAGDVILGTGDLIFGTANKGIVLGATTNVDANTLDDYEEGTWTPTLTEGTNTNASYDVRAGNYVKIGRTVFVEARINITSLGSISGNLRLAGLPFNVSNTVGSRATMNSGWAVGLDITAGQNISGYANGTTDYFWLTLWANAAGTSNLTHSTLSADGGFMMSSTYTTDS